MLRTTLAGLRLHKSRYVSTVLAILLGVMFISGTMVFGDTLSANYETSIMGSANRVDVIAVPETPESDGQEVPEDPTPFTDEQLDDVRALPEVAEADGTVLGQAVLLDKEGRAAGFMPPAALTVSEVSRFSAEEGSLPSTGDEVALATSTADQLGFTLGDTVTLLDPEENEREFTVTGLVEFGVDPTYSTAGAVVLDPATVQEMTGQSAYAEIDVLAAEGHTDQEAAEAVTSTLGPRADVQTSEDFGQAMAQAAGTDAQMISTSLLLFALIAMFVAGIVIYNTFAILIAQRQREMALLRCMGAERGQVFRSVLVESAVVGLIASALGVLAGVSIGMAGATFGGPLLAVDDSIDVVIAPTSLLTGLFVGTVVTVFSALVPATHATRVPPLTALRTSATATGLEKGAGRLRIVLGLLIFLASAALVGLGQGAEMSMVGLSLMTAAALTAFVGVVVLGPLLVRGIVRVVGAPLKKVSVPSTLAVDNSIRNPRRAATAMIALTVGATLITGYSVVSASVTETTSQQLDERFPIDYRISPPFTFDDAEAIGEDVGGPEEAEGPQEAPAEDEFETIDGATSEDTAEGEDAESSEAPGIPSEVHSALEDQEVLDKTFGERRVSTEVNGREEVPVTTFTDTEIGVDISGEVVEGDLSDMGPGRAAMSEGFLGDLEVGDTLTIASENGQDLSLEIVAIVRPLQIIGDLTIDEKDFTTAFPEIVEDHDILVRATEGADPAEVREAVHTAVDDHPTLQILSFAESRNQIDQILNSAFYTIAAMLGLAIVIAVFGIANTMALSILERTRESALLRSLGMARGQLRRMLSVEAVLLCLIGAGIGIVLGVVFGWAVSSVVLPGLIISIPVGQIAIFIAVAVVAGLLAAVLPARRAARTSVTGALASG